MTRNARRLIAVAATTLMAITGVQAEDGLSRADVRAELAQARAAGMMDGYGEAGTSDSVLLARDLHNQTEALALTAQYALAAEQSAAAHTGSDGLPELASYVEQGPDGPLLVVVTFDGQGELLAADTMSLSAID